MKIYGVALLAGCFLIGQLLGDYLGLLIGIDGNVGGVGLGMLMLVLINERFYTKKQMHIDTKLGILFWSNMYIPVVIAMSSILNVKAALSGGWVAVTAGIVGTLAVYFIIPFLSKLAKSNANSNPS